MADAHKSSHTIRIHAAWQRTELAAAMTVIQFRAMSLPDLHDVDVATQFLIYVRKFNAPTGLTDQDIVEIDCPLLLAATAIKFNGHSLTIAESATIDITRLLQKHNELAIHMPVSKLEVAKSSTARLLISTKAS